MAILDEIQRLTKAKQDFKTKLIEKGVTVSDEELISDYPQKLDLIKGGATITTPGGSWSGTPVPNSGYVEKVYFNTALSVEEVVGLLETLTMPSDDDPLTLVNIQSVKTIAAFYSSEMNVWAIVDLLNETFYFTTMDVGGGFVGWNPNISYPISINGETTPVNAGIDDLAIELNKISSLFSTTPFTQVGGEQVLLEGDYDGSTLILDEFPKVIWSGTPVPNSGYVEKVYINTNLTTEEVLEITRNIPITYILAASNAADNSNWLKYPFLYITRDNGQFVIMGCESGGSLKGYFNYGGEGDFIGWNPEFNGEFIVDHEVYPEHTDTGDTFGVYNEQLSSLFSTTPFVKSETNVINVKSLIDQKKIPLEIEVNVEEGTDTTDATATANEIRKGFTAYIASGKVEGAIEDYDGAFENEASGELVERSLKKLLDATQSTNYMFDSYNTDNISELINFNDTENVKNFKFMFNYFRGKIIPKLNTDKGINFQQMFQSCIYVEKIDITHFNISLTNNSKNMLYMCQKLKAFIIRSFGENYVLDSSSFNNCVHILGIVNSTENPNGLKDGYIYVPRNMIETLSSATNWSTHTSQLRALEDYTVDGTTTGEFDDEKAGLV